MIGEGARRQDCGCGAITGLFFTVALIQRNAADAPGEVISEYHYPAGVPQACAFYLNSRELKGHALDSVLVNSGATRPEPDKAAGCDVSTTKEPPRAFQATRDAIADRIGRNVREMNDPGRAAEALDRYNAMPDNP